jgi:hypothetical protein
VSGRPARHLYRLTGAGRAYASSAAAAAAALAPVAAAAPRRSGLQGA